MGDPGGSHFRPWPSPGRPQGARGANFTPSWANPFLEPDSGPQKSQKKLNLEGARTLKIELAPRRECNFHIFTSFLPEPYKHRFWELFWEPFGSLLAPIWLPGRLLGLPGAPQGRFFGHRFSDGFFDAQLATKNQQPLQRETRRETRRETPLGSPREPQEAKLEPKSSQKAPKIDDFRVWVGNW